MLQLAVTRACHAVIPLFICSDLVLCWLLQQHCSTCYSYRSKTLYRDLIKRGYLGVILPLFGCSFYPYTGVFCPIHGVSQPRHCLTTKYHQHRRRGSYNTKSNNTFHNVFHYVSHTEKTLVSNKLKAITFSTLFFICPHHLMQPDRKSTCAVKVKMSYNSCNIDGIES